MYLMNHYQLLENNIEWKNFIVNKINTFVNYECISIIQEKLRFNVITLFDTWKQILSTSPNTTTITNN